MAIIFGALLVTARPAVASSATGPAGRGLDEALAELQAGGLKLLFSDRVVKPTMRVEFEPHGGQPTELLRQLLEPHGLEARMSSSGWLVVVRRQSAEARQETQVVRVSDFIVVTPRVRVPVHVLDRGKPVRGLRAADFELLVGGERQEIVDFGVLDLSGSTATEVNSTTRLPAAARRHFLLAFDAASEGPGTLSRARTIAHRFVREGLHPADLIGLVTLSESHRPQFALGFTSDRRAIATSIDVVTGREPANLITDPLGLMVRPAHSTPGRRARNKPDPGEPYLAELKRVRTAGAYAADMSDWGDDLLSEAERTDRQAALARLLGLSGSMTELARMLRYAPGRKHIVFLSEGFDDSMLVGLGGSSEHQRSRIEEMNRAVEDGEIWKIDTDQRWGNDAAQSSFDQMLVEFTRSNSVIHAVDTRLDSSDGQMGSRSRNGLFQLATGTGGNYLAGGGDLERVLTSLHDTTSVTYLLSFSPPPVKRGNRAGRLRVRLRNGVAGRVLHSQSFFEPSYSEPASPAQRRLFRASRIVGGQVGGDFPSSLRVGKAIHEESHASVEVSVVAPVSSAPAAEIYVYALTVDGAVGDYFARAVSLDGDRLTAEPGRSFRIEGRLRLAPGQYRIRSLVLHPTTGASSLATAEIEVSSADASG